MELWETMTDLYRKMDVPPAGSDMETWKKTLVANVGTLLDTAWAATTSACPRLWISFNLCVLGQLVTSFFHRFCAVSCE